MSETKHSPTEIPWQFCYFTHFTGRDIETVEDVAETTAHTARNGDKAELWGVSIPGESGVVCYTGNGPTSQANAALIVKAVNNHQKLVDALERSLLRLKIDLYSLPASDADEVSARKDILSSLIGTVRAVLSAVKE